MAETSNGRVTITLGRTGQVVKRAATVPDGNHFDRHSGAGSKRSIRERLGNSSDSLSSGGSLHNNNKRQRGDNYLTSLDGNHAEDVRVGKNDLRYKLMQKDVSRRAQSNYDEKTLDLRQKLSRTVQPPGPPYSKTDTRQNMPTKNPSLMGRIPLARSADNMPRMDATRSSYSPWTLDHIRRRSPDRVISSSRGLSPPRNVEDLPRRPVSRTFEDPRAFSYISKDVLDAPRPRPVSSSGAFMTKSAMPSLSKPVAPLLSQLPPSSSIIQKTSYVGEEQLTVEGLLHALGLGKYAILFKAEEVDMTALKQMGEHDLKELGIPMGPRKKILLALLPRTKRQP